MLAKVSNDFSPPIRKNSCRLSSCVNVCLHCTIDNRHTVQTCRRSLNAPMIAPHFCAWQRLSQHSLLACAVRRKRLVSWNARKSCDSWLKTFWSARIPSPFVTAFRFLQVRPKTEDPTTQTVKITFCVSGVITAPCGVPVFVSDHLPSSITPAFSHFWISRKIRESATRCSTNLISQLVEVIEKSSNVGVQYVIHLLPQKRIRQRVQRLMLATPRARSVREAEKVFLVDLVEDGDHSLLNDLVLQRRDPQRAFPPVFFLYVHSSRSHRSLRPAINPAVHIDKSIFSPVFILLPRYTVHSPPSLSLRRVKASPRWLD